MFEATLVEAPAVEGADFVMFGVAVPAAVVADGVPWVSLPASGSLLDVLAGLDPGSLGADQVLDGVQALERIVSLAQGVQAELLARFAALRPGDGGAREFAADEVAPLLRVSRQQAASRVALAVDLASRFPDTLAAWRSGDVDVSKARALSELTASLSGEEATAVEAQVLPRAPQQTTPQFRVAVRRGVLAVDPAGGHKRERLARDERRVVLTPLDDGMAELWALLPAPEAVAIRDRIDRLARTVPAEDARTMDQRRVDCFTDLLLGTAPREVVAQIQVAVPAGTLIGDGDAPGHLFGYGPIGREAARELAVGALGGDTTWRRILTDPVDGSVLDVGRETYRPPAALADHVRARDRYCRFPGCRVPAARCDLDHTVPYDQGGATSNANLGALCRHHHRLKGETDWRLAQDEPGRFTWTTPTGRTYPTGPEPEPP